MDIFSSEMERDALVGDASLGDAWFAENGTETPVSPWFAENGNGSHDTQLLPISEHELNVMALTLTILAVIFTLATAGNILVCLVIMLYSQMRTTFNILLFNLAFTDLLVGVVVAPTYIARIVYEILGLEASDHDGITVVCHISAFTNYVCTAQSLLTITEIAIIRVIAVCKSAKHRRFLISKNVPCILIVINYATALTFSIFTYSKGTYAFCMDLRMRATIGHRFGNLAVLISILIIISLCYTWIFIRTKQWRSSSIAVAQAGVNHTPRPNRFDVATARTLLLVVGTWGVSYIPYVVFISLWATGLTADTPRSMTVFQALTGLCSVANPIIYTHNSAVFRRQLLRLLRLDKVILRQTVPRRPTNPAWILTPMH